jgi:hypothetical protein
MCCFAHLIIWEKWENMKLPRKNNGQTIDGKEKCRKSAGRTEIILKEGREGTSPPCTIFHYSPCVNKTPSILNQFYQPIN